MSQHRRNPGTDPTVQLSTEVAPKGDTALDPDEFTETDSAHGFLESDETAMAGPEGTEAVESDMILGPLDAADHASSLLLWDDEDTLPRGMLPPDDKTPIKIQHRDFVTELVRRGMGTWKIKTNPMHNLDSVPSSSG